MWHDQPSKANERTFGVLVEPFINNRDYERCIEAAGLHAHVQHLARPLFSPFTKPYAMSLVDAAFISDCFFHLFFSYKIPYLQILFFFFFALFASQSGVDLVSGFASKFRQNVLMHINYIAC